MKNVVILNDREQIFRTTKVAALIESLGFTVASCDHLSEGDSGAGADLTLKNADALVLMRERTKLHGNNLSHLGNVKFVSQTGTGTAHLDMEELTKRGIAVAVTPGASVPAVVELAYGLMFSCLRKIHKQDRTIKNGGWDASPGRELHGKRLGILGLGAIGSQVAKVAKAFGAEVVAWRPSAGVRLNDEIPSLPLDEVLATSDILSIHLRSLPQFQHLLNAERFALMKPGAVLINTSRGALVDTSALIDALKSERLAAAGLDTYEEEPLPASSPLLQFEQVVCTSHIGWVTWDTLERFALQSLQNIDDFFRGNENNVINPSYRNHV